MNGESVWQTLGLAPTNDRDQIRRAYSAKLKATNPEDDAEGFKALRAAYEQALQFVGRVPVQRVEADDQEAQDVEDHEFEDEVPYSSAALAKNASEAWAQPSSELDRRYAELRDALSADSINVDAAQRALREILASSELEHVTVRLNSELALAGLLMQYLPRTEELLLQTAIHFRWYELENRVGAPALLVNASRCARDITYLQALREGQQPYSSAFKALTTTPRAALLRLRIFTSDLDSRVRKLLHEFEYQRAYGSNAFDPEAVQWWHEYLGTPRVSKIMLWGCIVVPLFAAFARAFEFEPDPSTSALRSASMVLLAMVGLTAGKLYVLDWGRSFAKRRLPFISNTLLLVPFPLAVVFCAIASVYDHKVVIGVAALLASLCAAFAWFTRPELQVEDAANAWASIAYLNVPAAVWIAMIAFERSAEFALLCSLVVLTHVFTHPRLVTYWLSEISAAQRSRIIAGLLLLSLFAVAVWLATEAPIKLMIVASISLVLLQRISASSLSDTQYKIRYYGMYAVIVFTFAALDLSDRDAEVSIIASVFFLFGAIVGLSMALWNAIVNTPR